MSSPMKFDINVDLIDKFIKEHCELTMHITSNGDMTINIRPSKTDYKEEKNQDYWRDN